MYYYIKKASDGSHVCLNSAFPKYSKCHRWYTEKIGKETLMVKGHKILDRRYITRSCVASLTSFLPVPRYLDIRIVYDAHNKWFK